MPGKYNHQMKIRLTRGDERRHAAQPHPPFVTEEGLVLVDRRTTGERRLAQGGRKTLPIAA